MTLWEKGHPKTVGYSHINELSKTIPNKNHNADNTLLRISFQMILYCDKLAIGADHHRSSRLSKATRETSVTTVTICSSHTKGGVVGDDTHDLVRGSK